MTRLLTISSLLLALAAGSAGAAAGPADGATTIRADWVAAIVRADAATLVSLHEQGRVRYQRCMAGAGALYQCKNAYTILFGIRQVVLSMPARPAWGLEVLDRLNTALDGLARRIQRMQAMAPPGVGAVAPGSVPAGSPLWIHDLLYETLEAPA